MVRQSGQHKLSKPIWEDEDYGYDVFNGYDDYGDYSVNRAAGGGGRGEANRGGGCTNVYTTKHVRAMEARRASQK